MFLEVGDSVGCVGQSLALVLADTFQHALAAARAVSVTYGAAKTAPVYTVQVRVCPPAGPGSVLSVFVWCLSLTVPLSPLPHPVGCSVVVHPGRHCCQLLLHAAIPAGWSEPTPRWCREG
jgi:hypothetical protein